MKIYLQIEQEFINLSNFMMNLLSFIVLIKFYLTENVLYIFHDLFDENLIWNIFRLLLLDTNTAKSAIDERVSYIF